jgi:hypothetical protein
VSRQLDRASHVLEAVRAAIVSCEILARECDSKDSRERADIAKDRLERAFGHLAEIVHAERAAEVAEKANRCNVGRFEDCEASYGLTG